MHTSKFIRPGETIIEATAYDNGSNHAPSLIDEALAQFPSDQPNNSKIVDVPAQDGGHQRKNGSGKPNKDSSGVKANEPQAAPEPVRPRIVKVDPPAEPITFEEWRGVIAENFPTLVRPAEVCASVITQLLINDVSNPFALALVDVPSSGKTITLNLFSGLEDLIYTTDTFTAASFVSNSSNVTRQQLADIDLLPRIRYRTLVVRELASLFNAKDEDLKKTIGILTRVLDGDGYETDTGVHGKRGYKGDYLFMMLAGTTPISPQLFKALGNVGNRLFLMALHSPRKDVESLANQNKAQDRKLKEKACIDATNRFVRGIWSKYPEGIEWNKQADPDECLIVVARCADLLSRLRGAINVWPVGEDGERLTHSVPIIEMPDRINTLFYNLVRGRALTCGRTQITRDDLWPVIELTFDSAPSNRAKVFRALIEKGGSLTTDDVVNALHCSRPTALKEMEALYILGIAHKLDGGSHNETRISLSEEFEWFTSDECRKLLGLSPIRQTAEQAPEPEEQEVLI